MIRTRDTLLLASTKLKVRRIRLTVLLITVSLLFAGLVFVANVLNGTVKSLESFGKEGLGGRYLVQAQPAVYFPYDMPSAQTDKPSLVSTLEPLNKQLIDQKTAAAKKLGLNYDAKSDPDLYLIEQQTGPNPTDTTLALNTGSKLGNDAFNEQNAKLPTSFEDFSDQAKKAGAIKIYRATASTFMMGSQDGSISVLKNGKEDYEGQDKPSYGQPTGLDSIKLLGWHQMSDELLQPFLLPGQTTAVGKDGTIPVVAPFSAAEELLGLKKLPATASSSQKLARLNEVRQKIVTTESSLCYRSTGSSALLQNAISQSQQIAANKDKKDYAPPSLQYNLPAVPCGETTVKSDKRTSEEKKIEANQQAFDEQFDLVRPIEQGIIKIRIVGVTPDVQYGGGSLNATDILTGLFTSSLGQGWFSPASAFTPGSLQAKAQGGTLEEQPRSSSMYYAEFSDLAAAEAFIKQNDCSAVVNFNNGGAPNSFVDQCLKAGRAFNVSPFGNNAGAINDFQHKIWKVLRYVLLGVVVIAVLIMMGTFGKVIADSRRETAVFRALGATRFAIAQIYCMYTLLVCLLVTILSLGIGSIAAGIMSRHFGPDLSVTAVLTYNAADIHKAFTINTPNFIYLASIVGLIIASALVSALVPLLLNMRRNPIRDLRDE